MGLDLEDLFPNLANTGYEVSGEPSREYNCIAWALEITTQKWDCNDPNAYWPPHLPRSDRVETVVQLFSNQGFSICDNDVLEPGFEKIVIYAFVGQFTHVARQLEDGRWTSKLGNREVINHPSPGNLTESRYGFVHCIMRRPASDS